ncbi:hypothetical protein EX30DRAFT_393027 [Ascodesmis nigricans]|uniref:Localizes primarily to the nucleolus n=1 Tax=Ascodesmis nigricans TaxID=341454 RepID=A0A4S2N8L3_9PEZI|nr:hypothetical protein EX30DRAFT_393027 [Ascodesmis nigricans]
MTSTAADLPSLLETLTSTLTATTSSLPQSLTFPTPHGLSLLDSKNELLLSYLHHLSFLILLRTRSESLGSHQPAVETLIRLRALLEKGVKPLEGKLKYQIDKAVSAALAAEEAERNKNREDESDSGSSSDNDSSSSDDDDEDSISGSEDESRTKVTEKPLGIPGTKASDLAYRPNPNALLLAATNGETGKKKSSSRDDGSGLYRPPRIAATLMPEDAAAKKAQDDRPRRSRAMDEFIADEVSAAPSALPSIGSTIAGHGRSVKTARDRREEKERQDYEESNFVRLPKPSKKEIAAQRKRGMQAKENNFGGEDWTSFAGDLDKITKRAVGGDRALDRSRKRRGEDDGEGGGEGIGKKFAGRMKTLKRRRKM